jgi:hypothetical protein
MASAHQATQPNSTDATSDVLLVESNGASPLRILSIVAMFFGVGSLGLAAIIMDGDVRVGTSVSFGERLIWASILLVVMIGFPVGVSIYQRRIATRIVLLKGGRRLRITTPTLMGTTSFEVALTDVIDSQYSDGDKAGEQSIEQPRLQLHLRNKRTFVVPLGNNIPNKERLLSVLSVTR